MSKAISPMISAVLLIAFTVAVAGIISIWLPGFFTRTTGSVETATTNQTKCAGTYIDVFRVTSSTVFIRNPSPHEISSVSVLAGDGTSIASFTSLSPGDVKSASWSVGSNNSVIASGLCLGSVSVTGSCSVGDSCWQA